MRVRLFSEHYYHVRHSLDIDIPDYSELGYGVVLGQALLMGQYDSMLFKMILNSFVIV